MGKFLDWAEQAMEIYQKIEVKIRRNAPYFTVIQLKRAYFIKYVRYMQLRWKF